MKIVLSVTLVLFLNVLSGNAYALSYQESRDLLSLLEHEKFTQLESRLNDYFQAYEEDITQDINVDHALEALDSGYEWMPEKIEKWKSNSPDSYLPYLALALYHHRAGSESRGQKTIDKTTNKQVDKMQYHFNNAKLNFNKALKKKPDLLHAYAYLLNIAMMSGTKTEVNGYYERGLKINPVSHRLHMFYSFSLLPRWGGSVAELEKFSDEMLQLSKSNPRLKSLIGVVDVYNGDQSYYSGSSFGALEHYLKAEEQGSTWYLSLNMGDAYMRISEYGLAEDRFRRLISLRPMYGQGYHNLAKALMHQEQHEGALNASKISLEIKPDKYEYITLQAQLYFNLGDYDNALKYVTIAKQIKPDNARLDLFISMIDIERNKAKGKPDN